jgi:hypothetical protein
VPSGSHEAAGVQEMPDGLTVGLLPLEKMLSDCTVGYYGNGRPSIADGRWPTVNRRL